MRWDATISLHTGREMPVLGLGTWQLTADTAGTIARAVGGVTPGSATRIEGDRVMDRIEESVEIDAPVQAVYDQWARFEEFPDFIEAVKEVRWIDDTHLRWRARLAGEDVEWNAEIVEQTPFESIAWRGGAGMSASGSARFEPFDTERTRVTLTLELDPEAVPGHLDDAPDAMARQLSAVLDAFKQHVEAQVQAKRSGTPGVR